MFNFHLNSTFPLQNVISFFNSFTNQKMIFNNKNYSDLKFLLSNDCLKIIKKLTLENLNEDLNIIWIMDNITHLKIYNSIIMNFSWIKNLKKLVSIKIYNSTIYNFRIIRDCNRLEKIIIDNSILSDLILDNRLNSWSKNSFFFDIFHNLLVLNIKKSNYQYILDKKLYLKIFTNLKIYAVKIPLNKIIKKIMHLPFAFRQFFININNLSKEMAIIIINNLISILSC